MPETIQQPQQGEPEIVSKAFMPSEVACANAKY